MQFGMMMRGEMGIALKEVVIDRQIEVATGGAPQVPIIEKEVALIMVVDPALGHIGEREVVLIMAVIALQAPLEKKEGALIMSVAAGAATAAAQVHIGETEVPLIMAVAPAVVHTEERR